MILPQSSQNAGFTRFFILERWFTLLCKELMASVAPKLHHVLRYVLWSPRVTFLFQEWLLKHRFHTGDVAQWQTAYLTHQRPSIAKTNKNKNVKMYISGCQPKSNLVCLVWLTSFQEPLKVILKATVYGVLETNQWLETSMTLTKEQGSIPSTHTVTHNHLLLQFQGIQHSLLTSVGSCKVHVVHRNTQRHTQIHRTYFK